MTTLAAVTDFIAAHPSLAYGSVFLLALFEAVPLIGTVVPGSFLIIGIAALVPGGTLKMWPLMAAAILGAIAGDGLSYWLGHRYGETILSRWPLDRYPGLIAKSRAFIERHGGKSVFLARFTPGLRAFVPVVAGILRMPTPRFYLVNSLSALAWAPAHIVPGVLVGASLTLAGAVAGRLAALLIIVVVALWLVTWALRLALQRGVPLLTAGEKWLWQWASSSDTWLGLQTRPLLDPGRGETRALLLWAGVVVASAWIFFGVLEDVVSGDPLVRVDTVIYRALQGLRTPAGDAVMIAFTEFGDTVVTASVAIIVFLYLAWQRAWRTAAYWIAAVGFAATLNTITKLAIHRPRPAELAYGGASEFSFPSGHATVNAVMYGFLAFVIARQLRPTLRFPIFFAVAAFATLMAFSRLYLGAHWFSDVIGSLAFAAAWLVVLGIAYIHHGEPSVNAPRLAAVAGAALLLVGGLNVYRSHGADTQRYAVRYETPSIAATDWWASAWQQLPAYRVDLTGENEEPLTFQWAGSLQGIGDALLQRGWRRPESWTLSTTLAWLATSDPQALPVFPSPQAGRLPSLTLIKGDDADAASRFVFRAWAADIELRNGGTQPLWVGSVVEERISRPLSFFTFTRTGLNTQRPREVLAQALASGRLVKRDISQSEDEWDGLVLLAHEPSLTIVPPHNKQVENDLQSIDR